LNLIAVGNAHGQVLIAVPDPERVEQSRLKNSTLSGSDAGGFRSGGVATGY
jgi:hypothetical protein